MEDIDLYLRNLIVIERAMTFIEFAFFVMFIMFVIIPIFVIILLLLTRNEKK